MTGAQQPKDLRAKIICAPRHASVPPLIFCSHTLSPLMLLRAAASRPTNCNPSSAATPKPCNHTPRASPTRPPHTFPSGLARTPTSSRKPFTWAYTSCLACVRAPRTPPLCFCDILRRHHADRAVFLVLLVGPVPVHLPHDQHVVLQRKQLLHVDV
jgi:hypothetical protein